MKYKAQCSLDGKKWVGISYPPVETREKAWNIIAIVRNADQLKGAQFRVKIMRSNTASTRRGAGSRSKRTKPVAPRG